MPSWFRSRDARDSRSLRCAKVSAVLLAAVVILWGFYRFRFTESPASPKSSIGRSPTKLPTSVPRLIALRSPILFRGISCRAPICGAWLTPFVLASKAARDVAWSGVDPSSGAVVFLPQRRRSSSSPRPLPSRPSRPCSCSSPAACRLDEQNSRDLLIFSTLAFLRAAPRSGLRRNASHAARRSCFSRFLRDSPFTPLGHFGRWLKVLVAMAIPRRSSLSAACHSPVGVFQ